MSSLRFEGVSNVPPDYKRPAMPGITAITECPKCGNGSSLDMGELHIDRYSPVDRPFNWTLYCSECGHEWLETIIIRCSVTCEVLL